MKVTIVTGGTPEVHKAGCRDLERGRKLSSSYTIDAGSREEVSADYWCDIIREDPSYTPEDLVGEMRFLPCCKALPAV